MKIYIHAGNYKTGSTAIQSFLASNKAQFRELGYCIPQSGQVGEAHHAWAGALLDRPDAPDPDALYAAISNELAACGCDKAIVSSEILFNARVPEEIVRRLPGHEIVVVAYLRRQDEFASAFYMQLVKHPNFMESAPPDLSQFLGKSGSVNYLGVLESWAAALGPDAVIVRAYEKAQLPGGLVPDFLMQVGIAPDAFPEAAEHPSVNTTIQTELIEYLRIANKLGLSRDEHAALLGALTEVSRRTDPSTDLLHKRNVFSPEQRRQILAAWEADNAEIARRFLGRDDGHLFFDPPPEDDPSWQPMALSVETLAAITAALWIAQQKHLAELVNASDREFSDNLTVFLQDKIYALMDEQHRGYGDDTRSGSPGGGSSGTSAGWTLKSSILSKLPWS